MTSHLTTGSRDRERCPTVSVIMPCFNAAAYLHSSISSALSQSFTDLELIVIDDGSTDESASILAAEEDPRMMVLTQQNRGVCAARNAAIAVARGEFIAFLDADDTWHPDCISLLHAAITQSGATIAYCGWQNVGLPGPRGDPYVPPEYEDSEKLIHLFDNCRWPIHACLTRHRAITEVGGFDARFKTSEDYLLWLKIAKDKPIVRVPRVLAYYHHHAGVQATHDKASAAINHFRAQRSFLDDHPDDALKISAQARQTAMFGRLTESGLKCYWNGELIHARKIFRTLLREGRASPRHWKYMIPSLLPYPVHAFLVRRLRGEHRSAG